MRSHIYSLYYSLIEGVFYKKEGKALGEGNFSKKDILKAKYGKLLLYTKFYKTILFLPERGLKRVGKWGS